MSQLADLTKQVRTVRRTLDQQQGEARRLLISGKRLSGEVTTLKTQISMCEQAAVVLSNMAKNKQNSTYSQIEALVTQGLRTIFDEDMSFHIRTAAKEKVSETDFVIRSFCDGREIETPVLESRGGGLASVVGFLLRVVIMLLTGDKQEPFIYSDEAFAHLSEEFGPRLAEFLRYLVDNTPIQITLVTHTHVESLLEVADKKYKLELDKNKHTKITEL